MKLCNGMEWNYAMKKLCNGNIMHCPARGLADVLIVRIGAGWRNGRSDLRVLLLKRNKNS